MTTGWGSAERRAASIASRSRVRVVVDGRNASVEDRGASPFGSAERARNPRSWSAFTVVASYAVPGRNECRDSRAETLLQQLLPL